MWLWSSCRAGCWFALLAGSAWLLETSSIPAHPIHKYLAVIGKQANTQRKSAHNLFRQRYIHALPEAQRRLSLDGAVHSLTAAPEFSSSRSEGTPQIWEEQLFILQTTSIQLKNKHFFKNVSCTTHFKLVKVFFLSFRQCCGTGSWSGSKLDIYSGTLLIRIHRSEK